MTSSGRRSGLLEGAVRAVGVAEVLVLAQEGEHARGDRDQARHGHHATIIQRSSCEGSKVMSQSLDLHELRLIYQGSARSEARK